MGKAKLAEARVTLEYHVEGVWTLSPQGLGAGNAKLMPVGLKALCLRSDDTGRTGGHCVTWGACGPQWQETDEGQR